MNYQSGTKRTRRDASMMRSGKNPRINATATDIAITTATPRGTAISLESVASSIHMLTMIRKYKNAPMTAPTIATTAMAYERASTADLITPNFATNPDVNGTPACAKRSALKLSANSGLRKALHATGERFHWNTYMPAFEYCTDNAAMIAITAYYKYLAGDFAPLSATASARADW